MTERYGNSKLYVATCIASGVFLLTGSISSFLSPHEESFLAGVLGASWSAFAAVTLVVAGLRARLAWIGLSTVLGYLIFHILSRLQGAEECSCFGRVGLSHDQLLLLLIPLGLVAAYSVVMFHRNVVIPVCVVIPSIAGAAFALESGSIPTSDRLDIRLSESQVHVCDFDDLIEITIPLKNGSDQHVMIDYLKGSCTCIVKNSLHLDLPPGSSARVPILMDLSKRKDRPALESNGGEVGVHLTPVLTDGTRLIPFHLKLTLNKGSTSASKTP